MQPALHGIRSGDFNKPPVLFLHGFMGAHDEWNPIMSVIENHFSCLAVDLPGHGMTGSADDPEFYSFPGAATAIVSFLKSSGISRAHIVGYSLGGRLAIYLAIHHPAICDRVIIESSSPGMLNKNQAVMRRNSDDKWASRFEKESLETVLNDWYRQPVFSSLHERPDVLEKMLQRRMNNRPLELARAIRGFSVGAQRSLWSALRDIQVDMLVLAGESDHKYRQLSERIAAESSRIQSALMSGAGHNAHCEQPEQFAAQCMNWLLHKEIAR